jgi:choline-sulfatase
VKPNVLLVLVDQLVPFLTGPYGDRVVKTPALERLAGEGIRFDAAYTPYPLCSPARASLVTGVHASKLQCWDNASVLHADEPTVAHHLTNAGYETVLSGKMHFVGPDQLHGFRRRLTTDVFPAGMDWVPTQDAEGRFVRGGHARLYVPPRVGVAPWTMFLSFDEETHFRALEFIRERSRGPADEPFFLVASYHHPHDPFVVTQELWDLYDGVDVPLPERRDPNYTAMDLWANEAHETDAVPALDDPDALRALRRAYYGLVTYVDRKLGELVRALEETGQADRTVVVFTSDHGDMLGERRMVQKRTFYEWSVRVPLLVRLPDGSRAGETVAAPVSLLDLAPTLLDLAGVTDEERTPLDGESLLAARGDRIVFSEYHVEKVRAPCFMARKGRHKLVHVHGHDERLFDLEADPGEWHDLLGSPELAEVERELRDAVHARFDAARLAAEGAASIHRRELIARAMARNGTHWDHQPFFDARRQYVR